MSSSLVEQKEEEMIVNQALRLIGYPRWLITRHSRQQSSQNQLNRSRDTVAHITLPYIQGVFEHIRRVLAGLDIRVSLYPLFTLRRLLVRPKDPIDQDRKTGVVYRIN